jgi:hypothetical protein
MHTHTYTHTYTHAYTHTHTHIHTYIHTHIYRRTYVHKYVHVYMHARMHAYTHTHIHTPYTHNLNLIHTIKHAISQIQILFRTYFWTGLDSFRSTIFFICLYLPLCCILSPFLRRDIIHLSLIYKISLQGPVYIYTCFSVYEYYFRDNEEPINILSFILFVIIRAAIKVLITTTVYFLFTYVLTFIVWLQ